MPALFLAMVISLGSGAGASVLSREELKRHDPDWVRYIEACDSYHEYSRDLAPSFWSGTKWEPQLTDSIAEVDSFLAKDCKAYNDSRNSPELLAAFVPRLQAVSLKVSEARRNGLEVSARLTKATTRLSALYRKLGLDARESPCVASLKERSQHSQLRMQALLERTQKMEKLCPVTAETAPKAVEPKVYGQGAPVPGKTPPRVPAAKGGSDITGTDKAIDDAHRGASQAP